MRKATAGAGGSTPALPSRERQVPGKAGPSAVGAAVPPVSSAVGAVPPVAPGSPAHGCVDSVSSARGCCDRWLPSAQRTEWTWTCPTCSRPASLAPRSVPPGGGVRWAEWGPARPGLTPPCSVPQAEPEGFSRFHLYVCAAFLVRWRKEILEERDFQASGRLRSPPGVCAGRGCGVGRGRGQGGVGQGRGRGGQGGAVGDTGGGAGWRLLPSGLPVSLRKSFAADLLLDTRHTEVADLAAVPWPH